MNDPNMSSSDRKTPLICTNRCYTFRSVLTEVTAFFEGSSVTALYLNNFLSKLVLYQVLPENYSTDLNRLAPHQKIVFSSTIVISFIFLMSLLKTFRRMVAKTYRVTREENLCWTEKTYGRFIAHSIATIGGIYIGASTGFSTAESLESLCSSLNNENAAKNISIVISTVLSICTFVSTFAMFLHSNNKRPPIRNSRCMHEFKRFMIHFCSTGHSINNVFLLVDSVMILMNYYFRTNFSFSIINNSTSLNVLLYMLLLIIGTPNYSVVKITYRNLISQCLRMEKCEKLIPISINRPVCMDQAPRNKGCIKWVKIETAIIKAFLTGLSLNVLIASFVTPSNLGPNVKANIYIAGIPTLISFYAFFISRYSIYFKTNHSADSVDQNR